MKKTILSLLFLFLVLASANAQLYVEGDHNKDGKVSVADLTMLTDILTGKRAAQTPEMLIAGTWRSKDGDAITLRADGTTDYAGAKTFKYNNVDKNIVFYDSSSRIVKLFNVADANFGFLNLNIPGESTNTIYYNSVFFASSITLSDTQLSLGSGTTHQLTATLAPLSAFNTSYTWSSSNPSVATVSNTGLVTAKGSGSAVISAIAADGSGVSAHCSVSVVKQVQSISLSATSLTLAKDSYHQLTATVSPSDADNVGVEWTSSNTSVAQVINGVVVVTGTGTAVITATATDGSGVSASCTINAVATLITSVQMSQSSLSLREGATSKLSVSYSPSNATGVSFTWSSSNPSVASVDNNGNITAISAGTSTITATLNGYSSMVATATVTVSSAPVTSGHEYVDLGLPSGLKWATCNLGAENPEDYGYYYAWGATEPQDVYDWVHCPFQTQNTTSLSSTKFTKYLGSTSTSYKDANATDANALKTVLDLEDDAAHVNWGGDWRMPTRAEQDELRQNCYWKWVTSYNGKSVKGYIVYKVKNSADKGKYSNSYSPVGSYSVSDPHLFLPAAGYRGDSSLYYAGSSGYCWSSSLLSSGPDDACYLYFDSGYVDWGYSNRYGGHTVRAVCP